MKILFITEPNLLYPYLGIMSLSSILKSYGHKVEVVFNNSPEKIIKEAKYFLPDILAFSVHTGLQDYFLHLNKKIKKEIDVFSIFGGPHPTFSPEIIEEDGVDAVCIGEGEEAIAELVNSLQENRDISKIKNWHVKINGKIIKNDIRPLIENLNNLPFPDYELFFTKSQVMRNLRGKNFMASRGCPFNCTYCFNQQYFQVYKGKGKRIRFKSVDYLIHEIKEVKNKYPTMNGIVFHDDNFIFNKEWLIEFQEKYKKEIDLPFWCNISPSLITNDIAKILSKANCVSVTSSIEAGNDFIREKLLNRKVTKEQIKKAFKILSDNKINVLSHSIIGLPYETFDMALETLKFNIECKPTLSFAHFFYPYPKTILGEIARKEGLISEDVYGIMGIEERITLKIDKKQEFENLKDVFLLSVKVPLLFYFIKILVKIQIRPFYKFIHYWLFFWCNMKLHPSFSWIRRYKFSFLIYLGYLFKHILHRCIRRIQILKERLTFDDAFLFSRR